MNKKNLIIFAVVVIGVTSLVLSRLVIHIPNFAPLTALAIFIGYALRNKTVSLITLLTAVFISDVSIELFSSDSGFYPSQPFVYGSYALIALLSGVMNKIPSLKSVLGVSILSSVLFFLISNFGVWIMEGFYAHTLSGLVDCYIKAIPFYRNSLVADVIFSAIFFGSYVLTTRSTEARVVA